MHSIVYFASNPSIVNLMLLLYVIYEYVWVGGEANKCLSSGIETENHKIYIAGWIPAKYLLTYTDLQEIITIIIIMHHFSPYIDPSIVLVGG